MKKLYILLTVLLVSAMSFAQAPEKMSYQAVIRKSDNALVTSAAVGMQISILQGSASGTAVYVETQTPTTNSNGLVSIAIGSGALVTGSFSGINWATGPYFIKTETDPTGGTTYTITGTTELMSVPYALYAKNGITTAQADAIATQAAQISSLQAQISTLLPATLPSVTIGTQIWQNTNLDVTTYRDGTPIPQVTDPTAWANLKTGAWCYYNNDANNGTTYGKLYNWYAVMGIAIAESATPTTGEILARKKLAPTGWHVSTDGDWTTLTDYLGGESVAGGALKETSATYWLSPNTDATNRSGFTGLPGGCRLNGGPFSYIGGYGFWWSSREVNTTLAWYRNLYYNFGLVSRGDYVKTYGFSVRCIRD